MKTVTTTFYTALFTLVFLQIPKAFSETLPNKTAQPVTVKKEIKQKMASATSLADKPTKLLLTKSNLRPSKPSLSELPLAKPAVNKDERQHNVAKPVK